MTDSEQVRHSCDSNKEQIALSFARAYMSPCTLGYNTRSSADADNGLDAFSG